MRLIFGLAIYRLLLPLLFVAAFPGWVVKMLRRGGLHTRLGERAAIYAAALKNEPRGAIHLHAVSVGEAMLALKLIREWQLKTPNQCFVLATGTATGHAVATAAKLPGVRVTYAPLDFPGMVRRYLKHFEPSQLVLVEGEAWPHLLLACRRRSIPVSLVNARMSPRSSARYRRFAAWVRPFFGLLDAIAIQDPQDAAIWQQLGVATAKIHLTGSLKIDPGSGQPPTRRPAFQALLDALAGPGSPPRPIVLAASTHPGEEAWIASAIRDAEPHALILIVPRHAERRAQVKADLVRSGFDVVLRSPWPEGSAGSAKSSGSEVAARFCPTPSGFEETPIRAKCPDHGGAGILPAANLPLPSHVGSSGLPAHDSPTHPTPLPCLVIDTTGELRDWTAHANVVIIGKSFLATGGQNPCEAILASIPIVFGPHMENFQPLAASLIAAHAVFPASDSASLSAAIRLALDPTEARAATTRATALLQPHHGATRRIVNLLAGRLKDDPA